MLVIVDARKAIPSFGKLLAQVKAMEMEAQLAAFSLLARGVDKATVLEG